MHDLLTAAEALNAAHPLASTFAGTVGSLALSAALQALWRGVCGLVRRLLGLEVPPPHHAEDRPALTEWRNPSRRIRRRPSPPSKPGSLVSPRLPRVPSRTGRGAAQPMPQ